MSQIRLMQKKIIRRIKKAPILLYDNTINQLVYLFGKKPKTKRESEPFIPENAVEIDVKICPIYQNKKGIITIISDDGDYETGKNIKKLAEQFEIPITVAATVRNAQHHRKFWKDFEGQYTEIVTHSYNHIRMEEGKPISKNKRKLRHEIIHSRQYFAKLLKHDVPLFVCPENQMCSAGYNILKEDGYYAVARGTRGINDLSPADTIEPGGWYNLKRVGIKDDFSLQHMKKWISEAKVTNRWLIEMWHNVKKTNDGGYQSITYAEAEQHLKSFNNEREEIWICKFSDALKYTLEREKSKVLEYKVDGEDYLFIQIADLPDDYFNFPLTIILPNNHFEYRDGIGINNEYSSFCDMLPNRSYKISDLYTRKKGS